MVAIIGVLAAVAIPAYQKYQANAKLGVIKGSINQIIKAYNACIAVESVATCATNDIDDTLKEQPNAMVVATAGTGTPAGGCFVVTGSGALAMYSGCVGLGPDGEVLRQSSDTDISTLSTTAACAATMTACTN